MEEELVHEAYGVKPIFGGHNFFLDYVNCCPVAKYAYPDIMW